MLKKRCSRFHYCIWCKVNYSIDKDVELVANKLGVQTWHVIFFVVVLVLAVIGVCSWCVVRFLRKKRRGKDGKDADLAADEAALVENDEEDLKADEAELAAAKGNY